MTRSRSCTPSVVAEPPIFSGTVRPGPVEGPHSKGPGFDRLSPNGAPSGSHKESFAIMTTDTLTIAGKTYSSRLLVGTGKYKDMAETKTAIETSGA